MVESVLGRDVSLSTEGFYDDLTAHGNSWEKVWEDTIKTLYLLAEEGIMINIKKCRLLVGKV